MKPRKERKKERRKRNTHILHSLTILLYNKLLTVILCTCLYFTVILKLFPIRSKQILVS